MILKYEGAWAQSSYTFFFYIFSQNKRTLFEQSTRVTFSIIPSCFIQLLLIVFEFPGSLVVI